MKQHLKTITSAKGMWNTFRSNSVKYLVLRKSNLQQWDSAIASLQRHRLKMEKQGDLGGNVLLDLGRQRLLFESHSYL